MAASAVAAARSGRPQKRKSRRALAQSFLSGISLDGQIVRETRNPKISIEVNVEVENSGNLPSTSEALTTAPVRNDVFGRKPKYMHSISESAALEMEKASLHSRERAITSGASALSPEHRNIVRRSHSMSESLSGSMTESSISNRSFARHRITCMSGTSLRSRRKLNDKRILLCTPRKIPFLTYSVLKYHKENQEAGYEGTGMKRSSAPSNQNPCIDGVEIGTGDKSVSYSMLLVPTYPLAAYRCEWNDSIWTGTPPLQLPSLDKSLKGDSMFAALEGSPVYDPYELDDPELTSGKHRTVLQLSSYMVSMIAYAKPSELKKDLNERFREKFPRIDITLTKLRSLKKDILKVASSQDCQLDHTTVAYAFVYFEKLIMKEKINKPNRKLMAGACILLAAKFNDDKRIKIKSLIDKIEDKLKVQVRELLCFEFQALVGLDFNLHVPVWEVFPHVKRLESEQL